MKALISYKDWLLLNRGEIKPEIGDKILTLSKERSFVNRTVVETGEDCVNISYVKCSKNNDYFNFYVTDCYVEVDYDPKAFEEGYKQAEYCYRSIHEIDRQNHAIEFAEYCGNLGDFHNNKWIQDDSIQPSTEELYQQFLNEKEVQQT